MMSLAGRRVVVTGGGGGIGRAMVEAFRDEDARVIAADVDEERLETLAAEVSGIEVVTGDVSTPEGADAIMAAAGGAVDVLCNNAGLTDRISSIEEITEELWARVVAVNLTGAFLLSKRAIPGMLERGHGVIVNTSSVSGLRGGRGGVAYASAKHGLIGLTTHLGSTYGAQGIRCNAICPGPTDAGSIATAAVPLGPLGQRVLQRDREIPPAGSPAGIASVAVFLARPEGARINGVAIPVDDGWLAF
jgi:NAD(P)-dependent dehydrogenase (short-subunit alcohol dehydrogenase family)